MKLENPTWGGILYFPRHIAYVSCDSNVGSVAMSRIFHIINRKRFLFFMLALAIGLLVQTAVILKNRTLEQNPNVLDLLADRMVELSAEYEAAWTLSQDLLGDLLVEAIIEIESGGHPRRVGAAGERGLMQIMPETWADMTRQVYGHEISFDRAFDPELNRRIGRHYLAFIQRFLRENEPRWRADERSLLLACYNGGLGRVEQAGFDLRKLPASVQDYARRGSALHNALVTESLQEQHRTAAHLSGMPLEGSDSSSPQN